jgi:serine/threonine protein kinase
MGVVYLGADREGRAVAIKLVHAPLSGNPEFRARFRSEVERARQVPSFCTAEVLDADLQHDPPYLVVEYVDGPSLFEVVNERGPLTASNLHSVAVGVAMALVGIHGAGVIHRDLKPQNVLLAPGTPKVIDFGIARAFEATSEYTRTGHMVGTVSYMAPERFSAEPGTPLTPAIDIFAWGCVIAYAGTGSTPFRGDSPEATAGRILTQPPRLNGLTEPLRGLVELAVRKDPADRPTARELLDMLMSGGTPAAARPARTRPTGLPPGVASLLPPYTGPAIGPTGTGRARSAEPGSGNSGSGNSGDFVPAQHRPHDGGRPSDGRPSEDRLADARSGAARPAGLRPDLAAFLEPSGSRPAPDITPAPMTRRRGIVLSRHPAARLLRAPLRSSRWLVLSSVLAVAAVISGGAWLGRELTAGDAEGRTPVVAESATSPSATESGQTLTDVIEPTGGTVVLRDALTTAGIWTDDGTISDGGRCTIRGVLRAARTDRVEDGVHQCPGPNRDFQDDVGVTVTTTLESASTCAAIWFHWTDQGGDMLRVCPAAISVATDAGGRRTVLGSLKPPRQLALKVPIHLHLVVRAGSALVWVDGGYAGAVPLPGARPAAGRILLGVSEQGGDDPPPYSVTFADLEIRSIRG